MTAETVRKHNFVFMRDVQVLYFARDTSSGLMCGKHFHESYVFKIETVAYLQDREKTKTSQQRLNPS